MKKAIFDLSAQELDDAEFVFEYALKEMASRVNTDLPLFSKIDSEEPIVTVFLSGKSAGQSSTVLKLQNSKKHRSFEIYRSLKATLTASRRLLTDTVTRTVACGALTVSRLHNTADLHAGMMMIFAC